MRRFLSISLVTLALLMGATGAAPVARADTATDSFINTQLPTATTQDTSYSLIPASITSPAAAAPPAAIPSVAASAASGTTQANTGANTATDPDLSSGFGAIMAWIMSLFAWLVGVAALTLDYAVYYTVVTMGSYVSHLTAVGVAWRVLRDAANIMLIFGFLMIGITTILNVDWYGKWQKLIPSLLVAAVALNFSLFISEAMIDGTNLIAVQFYQQINGGSLPTMSGSGLTGLATNGVNLNTGNEPISNAIMGQLGLATLYNVNGNQKALEGDHTWIIGWMGVLLFIITAFVLFSLAFILIARFVALIFFILLSPVGFMGMALPMMQYRAGQWWDNFLAQIVTAPVLLLLLYVALAIITDANFISGFHASGSWLDTNNLVGYAGILLSFLVAIGFLLMVVIKAKSMSAFGASWATKTAGKLSFGTTAWVGTKVGGLPSHYIARTIKTSAWGGTRSGRVAASAFDRAAKASYDVRGSVIGGVLKERGVDAGKVAESGYQGQRERALKGHETYVKSIDKAFEERGAVKNKEEKETIARVTLAHEDAEKAKVSAQAQKDSAEERVKRYGTEVTRLAEIDKNDKAAGRPSSVASALKGAQQNLADSQKDLATATTKLATAATTFEDIEKAKAAAEKASETRMGEEKKAVKKAYAEKLGTKNPLMWTVNLGMYGPGTAEASRKITKGLAKKKTKDQLGDLLKKLAKEEKEKEGEGEKNKESKPEEVK
ncbi:MAG: hypothetical protein ACYC48_00505 [Minisyncoccota bacterium]